jgi:hypothetical protein
MEQLNYVELRDLQNFNEELNIVHDLLKCQSDAIQGLAVHHPDFAHLFFLNMVISDKLKKTNDELGKKIKIEWGFQMVRKEADTPEDKLNKQKQKTSLKPKKSLKAKK